MRAFGIVAAMSISEFLVGDVLVRGELLAAGFGDQDIRAALMDGSLLRLHRGVYAAGPDVAGAGRPVEVLRILGVARRSPAMVVSHGSAAIMHRLPLWRIDPNVVHLTRPPGGGAVRRPGRIVHSAAFADDEVVERSGVEITSVARTLVDLARTYGFESSVIACDYALHGRLVTPGDLRNALDRARQRPGRRAAARAFSFADGRAESPGESRTRVLMMRAGLQAPELQIEVHDRLGNFLGRTDLGYPEDSAVIEFDGKVKYQKLLKRGQSAADVVIAEKQREEEMRGVGTSMLRVIWSELGHPDWLVARINENPMAGEDLAQGGYHHRNPQAAPSDPHDAPWRRVSGAGRSSARRRLSGRVVALPRPGVHRACLSGPVVALPCPGPRQRHHSAPKLRQPAQE
jgi:hypothetical protein